ncbi:hypothetical protein ULMA_07360 [Patiriisocius marinus]|uniref:Uncharacterized protein n=1 Tax=Patiriisocius marinus TaxID=1397112 RepID=A0A5J4IYC9_9FLAO|nr:hypothetical protein ULMA_07360 [Patiriisocius marinus]
MSMFSTGVEIIGADPEPQLANNEAAAIAINDDFKIVIGDC